MTPADFMGVDEAQVITIARIVQALDFDGDPQDDGISISQAARNGGQASVGLLKDMQVNVTGQILNVPVGDDGRQYTIPSASVASVHLADTRKCLFSGGYVGDYEGTLADNSEVRGQSYYAVEPFVNLVRTFTDSTVNNNEFESLQTSTVGVIGSVITLSPGNELSFITPRLVAGVWQYTNNNGDVISSGTETLTFAADTGNPGATRRIVGVETAGAGTVAGMYVLDYFEEETVFRGRHYGVDATSGVVSSMPLSLTIAGGGPWPTDTTETELVLSGTLGGEATAVTVDVIRVDGNYGTFTGAADDSELSGTWCDISGATGVAVLPPQTPPQRLSASARSEEEIVITWSAVSGATSYNLYRSTSSDGVYFLVGGDISATTYTDSGLSADTEYFYRLEACNSGGCSEFSSEVSATTQDTPPVVSLPPVDSDQCRSGQALAPGQSCIWRGHTLSVSIPGRLSQISLEGPLLQDSESHVAQTDPLMQSGTTSESDHLVPSSRP